MTDATSSLRDRVDGLLASFLEEARREVAGDDPGAAPLVDEVIRVVTSGGKRLRPAFCVWELGAVCHEQDAWSRYLLSERDADARRAYLEAGLDATV